MHALVRKSSFSKAQGLRETGSYNLRRNPFSTDFCYHSFQFIQTKRILRLVICTLFTTNSVRRIMTLLLHCAISAIGIRGVRVMTYIRLCKIN